MSDWAKLRHLFQTIFRTIPLPFYLLLKQLLYRFHERLSLGFLIKWSKFGYICLSSFVFIPRQQ